MTKTRTFITIIFLLIYGVWSTQAQSQCDFDIQEVISRVSSQCADIEANEVCYGNRDVIATPRDNVIDLVFDSPGDRASLANIQSLIVETINPDARAESWGVAQLRLLVGSTLGLRDVDMLLFGEFDVRNAGTASDPVELQVIVRELDIYDRPLRNTQVLETVSSGAILIGRERVQLTNTWLRVESAASGVVGWIEDGSDFRLVNEAQSIGLLPEGDPALPYFGAMQAFYFENGNSDIGCENVESDGLIIQTPEGQARVSLLINEVSIEIVGGRDVSGVTTGGRAFVQADPDSETGMTVNVLQGEATVTTGDSSQTFSSGQRISIPISVDIDLGGVVRPAGIPAAPTTFDSSTVSIEPMIPAMETISITRENNPASTRNNSSSTGSSNDSSSSQSSSTGGNISIDSSSTGGTSSTGDGSGTVNVTGGSTTGGSTSSNSDGGGVVTSSSSGGGFPDNGGSTTGGGTSNSDNTGDTGEDTSIGTPEIIGFTIAIILLIFSLGFFRWSARQTH